MKDESGYAFPHQPLNAQIAAAQGHPGITVHDYFAAAALSGIAAKYTISKDSDYEEFAKMSHELADAMIKERGE